MAEVRFRFCLNGSISLTAPHQADSYPLRNSFGFNQSGARSSIIGTIGLSNRFRRIVPSNPAPLGRGPRRRGIVNNPLEEHVAAVYRFALRLASDCHLAEDLTQEAFLRGLRNLDRLRDHQAARTWLLRIVHNLWRDALRRGRSPVARALALPEDLACRQRHPGQRQEDEDEVLRAREALDSLPPRQREVLHLRACEDLSPAEIAEVLDVSLDAVKVSLCLARKKMRELLQRCNDDLRPKT